MGTLCRSIPQGDCGITGTNTPIPSISIKMVKNINHVFLVIGNYSITNLKIQKLIILTL
jgi:hypothetical protein